MASVRGEMSGDHRHCDELFAAVESAVNAGQWAVATEAFASYRKAMLAHFDAEEKVLFPVFEERTGMRMGPTQVMRNEHAQMRELIEAAGAGVAEKDAEEYSGYAETLLIMMQQHNMKEENVLYPMCDEHLADRMGTLIPSIEQVLRG